MSSKGSNTLSFKWDVGVAGLSKQLSLSQKRLKHFGKSFTKLGDRLTRTLTPAILGLGVAALKMSSDFETSMTKLQTLVGISAKEVDKLRDSVLGLSKETGQAPRQLAESLFFITSAGLRSSDALEALEQSAKAAAIGMGDQQQIADALTSAVNAYTPEILSAAKATDIMLAAVRAGKMEPSELAAAIGQVLPVAAEMGVSFEEVAASLAQMSKSGTKVGQGAVNVKIVVA